MTAPVPEHQAWAPLFPRVHTEYYIVSHCGLTSYRTLTAVASGMFSKPLTFVELTVLTQANGNFIVLGALALSTVLLVFLYCLSCVNQAHLPLLTFYNCLDVI